MTGRGEAKLPLAGRGVVVTRAERSGGRLARRFDKVGATVLRWQGNEIVPPDDPAPLAEAVATLASVDWIVFASIRAVHAVSAALAELPESARAAARPRRGAAVVGGSTATAAKRAGFEVACSASRFGAAGLLAELATAHEIAGEKVFFPRSSASAPRLARGLRDLGASVEEVVAYMTRPRDLDGTRCRADLAAGRVDAITFTSPSSLDGIVRALGRDEIVRLLCPYAIVSIGPTTTRALADLGLPPAAEANPCTLDGLVAATAGCFA